MLSEDTQIIVNLISGALLGLLWVLWLSGVIITSEGASKKGKPSTKREPNLAAYAIIFVIVGILVPTIYIGPVEIRWWYLIGGAFGFLFFPGSLYLLILDERRKRVSTSSDRENGSDT